jgi:hypothetical protein
MFSARNLKVLNLARLPLKIYQLRKFGPQALRTSQKLPQDLRTSLVPPPNSQKWPPSPSSSQEFNQVRKMTFGSLYLRTSQVRPSTFANFARSPPCFCDIQYSFATLKDTFANFSNFLWELRKFSLRTSRKEIFTKIMELSFLFWSVWVLECLNPWNLAI